MKLNIYSKYKIDVVGAYSYRNEDGEYNTFPIGFEESGLSVDDVVKYINYLVVESPNFSDLTISYFNSMSGEDKKLKLTISEVENDTN